MRRLTRSTNRRVEFIPRYGFTLLEVIFALGLSFLLLTAVLAAVNLYRHVSTVGRRDMEEAQLARSLFRMMELDIRSAMFRKSTDENESGESDTLDAESLTADEEEIVAVAADPAAALSGQNRGITGDTFTLVIHANRPVRPVELLLVDPVEAAIVGLGDLKSISYFLATMDADGLPGLAGALAASQSNDGDAVQGLARLEADRQSVEFADATGDLDSMALRTRLLAREVAYLQFRYFDGAAWNDAWNSVTYGRLPNAVEVTLGFRTSEEVTSQGAVGTADAYPFGLAHLSGVGSLRLHRHVVLLPTNEPPPLASAMEAP